MVEYMILEGMGLAIAFGLGFLAGRGRKFKSKVKVPDYVPADWKFKEDS